MAIFSRRIRARSWVSVLSFVSAALFAASGGATPQGSSLTGSIELILSQRHPTDTPETWRALGPQAPAAIISMYQSSSDTYRRARLLQGLGAFDSSDTREFLRAQAASASEPVLRQQAIRTVGVAEGPAAADFLAQFLQDDDAQTRLAAAEALRRMNDAHAQGLVADHLKKEKAGWLVSRIQSMPSGRPSAAPIALVGSAEAPPAPELFGRWRGFWISPASGTPGALISHGASLKLTHELQGALALEVLGGAGKPSARDSAWGGPAFTLEKLKAHGPRLYGLLKGQGPQAKPLAFEAEISYEAGSWLLILHLPEIAATVVLRREAGA